MGEFDYQTVADILFGYSVLFDKKVVYCNCDDPSDSLFWKYFHLNFSKLNVKELISTHYHPSHPVYQMRYTGGNDGYLNTGYIKFLDGNGAFYGNECINIFALSDIVISMPSEDLFSSYVFLLTQHPVMFMAFCKNRLVVRDTFSILRDFGRFSDISVCQFGDFYYLTNFGK